MLAPKSVVLNEAHCPVDEKELTQINSQSPRDTLAIATKLPLEQKARLCHFCYSKAHLHSLALHIASTLDLRVLEEVFGKGGKIVFEQSRDVDSTLAKLKHFDREHDKRPVTLAPVSNINDN
ncbi:MAG: hypothetical protein GY742_00390 [Hyphomicrobiales bacterium]|nr:hypothetical protein [Hyphomicrobiales bacterium]